MSLSRVMAFHITLGRSTTVGGVTRYSFSVELPRAGAGTEMDKVKAAPIAVRTTKKAKVAEK